MADDKKISELPVASALTGSEAMEVVQGGINKQTTSQDLANISGGGPFDQVSVDVSGGTITLDIDSFIQRMFEGNASFGTPKTIALSNDTNALVINFKFNLSNVAAVLTFPSEFRMQTVEARWSAGANTFTPTATGVHEGSATYSTEDDAWDLKMTHPFS